MSALSASDLNDRLHGAYEAAWPALSEVVARTPGASGVHLVRVPEAWPRLPVRLAVVGQQTAGWDRCETATDQRARYPDDGFVDAKSHTPFWCATREIADALNDPDHPVLWCNLVAVDVDRKAPPEQVRNAIRAAAPPHGLLRTLLEITQPDAVVFLTGPSGYYRWEVQQQFDGITEHPVDGCPEKSLCRLSHPALPPATFRLYHPNYLRRSKQWPLVGRVIAEVRRELDA